LYFHFALAQPEPLSINGAFLSRLSSIGVGANFFIERMMMKKIMIKIRCFLGKHDWEYTGGFVWGWSRRCRDCKKKEQFLDLLRKK